MQIRRLKFAAYGVVAIVVTGASVSSGATIISDGFSEYGSAPNNTTSLAGRTPDTVDVPGTTYQFSGNNGGTSKPTQIPQLITSTGNPSPSVETLGNGSIAISLNAFAPTTISADLSVGTLVQSVGNTYRGVGLGFYSTFSQEGTGSGPEANTNFTGLVVNPGNATDGAAGTLRLVVNGVVQSAFVAPFTGFSSANFYNLSYSVNTATGQISNVIFNGNNDSATFASATGFTPAATKFAGFYGSSDTSITDTAYVDNLTVAPEPASLSFLGLASIGLLFRRRRM